MDQQAVSKLDDVLVHISLLLMYSAGSKNQSNQRRFSELSVQTFKVMFLFLHQRGELFAHHFIQTTNA